MDSPTDPMTRCPKCFNSTAYCTCQNKTLRLVADNSTFPCLCCDTPMATDYVPLVGYICGMCMDHFTGHPIEIMAIHNRLQMHAV